MSKFRAMALKVEDDCPSPLASTSLITLEDHPTRSPSKVKVEFDLVKMQVPPVATTDDVRPSLDPSDDVDMENEGQLPQNMVLSPKAEDSLPTKTKPSRSTSASASPKPESTTPTPRKPLKKGPQLIDSLPIAREAAMKTFIEIQENHYQYSTLGRSREALESMTCECPPNGSGECSSPLFGVVENSMGEGWSDGQYAEIPVRGNLRRRLHQSLDAGGVSAWGLQGRCLLHEPTVRLASLGHCFMGALVLTLSRFQRQEYARIDIVQTDKKGFGLRAAQDMSKCVIDFLLRALGSLT